MANFCSPNSTTKDRRLYINKKKHEMLSFYKDSLERRISAVSASINTLEQQIERDSVKIDQ